MILQSTSLSNQLAAVARLQVYVGDVNDKIPVFQGTDENGIYPAAVSSYTKLGDLVIYVTAIDQDRDAPNNVVCLILLYVYGLGASGERCVRFSSPVTIGVGSTFRLFVCLYVVCLVHAHKSR